MIRLPMIIALSALSVGGAACRQPADRTEPMTQDSDMDSATDRTAGPGERAGEAVDDAARKAGEKIERGTEKAGEKIEDAGEKIQDSAR